MREFTVYRRNGFAVVPLIRGFRVERDGQTIYRYETNEINEAIEMVDELAAGIAERVA